MNKELKKLLVILLSVIVLSGCYQNTEERVEELKEQEETLLIFSVGNSSILSDFQAQNPEKDIEIVVLSSNDVEKEFEDNIYEKGVPDIIIDTMIRASIRSVLVRRRLADLRNRLVWSGLMT